MVGFCVALADRMLRATSRVALSCGLAIDWIGLAFGLSWPLWGLWSGVSIDFCSEDAIEGALVQRIDWQRYVKEAKSSNKGL
jgi:hypothetical protein